MLGQLWHYLLQVCQISVTLMSWDEWWVELDLFTTYFSDKVLLDTFAEINQILLKIVFFSHSVNFHVSSNTLSENWVVKESKSTHRQTQLKCADSSNTIIFSYPNLCRYLSCTKFKPVKYLLFIPQNSRHLWTVEEYVRIYLFFCFKISWHIWTVHNGMQNSWHFVTLEGIC